MKKYLPIILALVAMNVGAQRSVIDLNGSWQFDRTEKAFPPAKFRRAIPVPGLIHLAEPKIDDYDIWFKKPLSTEAKEAHGVYDIDYVPKYNWYKKVIRIDESMEGKELLLRIKKSQYVTQVYVNGIDMGTSMECYTPIEIPVTRAIHFGQENEFLIKVGDRYWLPPQAAGSTDKEKEHYLPGIWDDVELVASGKVQVNNTLFLPDAKGGRVTAKVRLRSFYPQQVIYGDPVFDAVTVKVDVYEQQTDRKVGSGSCVVEARRENLTVAEMEIGIENPHLWSPDDPFLYKTTTTLLLNDQPVDLQEDHFGLRDFERRGKYFYLNGEKILLRGTNITLQRFFEDPDCGNLAWDREWVKQLIIDDPKQIHWNAMRICVGIVPDFWYDLADEYGMMFQNEWNYWQTHGWDEQVKKEYTNWVWSDGNHPGIVIWDAINENWDAYIGNTLIPELQQLDPTRPWDAGYMTSSHMGIDEMDEPHPYEGITPWTQVEEFDKDPYPLGDLDYRNQANIASIESSAAQLVNEYGWIWLWRDGRTAKLTRRIFEYYLGDATDPDANREFQAYWLQCETEWLRSIREHAGVLAFTHLTNNYGYTGDWYINDIKDLEPGPTLSWFQHAFAPSAVFINHPDERYMKQFKPHQPGSRMLFTLKAINDFNEQETGLVHIHLIDNLGKSVWAQDQTISIPPYGNKNYPVVLDLPEVAGGYLLVTEFEGKLNPVKKQISRRYINVGGKGNQFFKISP
ncbi:MAG: glycoside hydrolase family 2 [Bacteroidales bacterium]|nr:glycoside hydrolase family 2 [Bacteroidales bacterium]